MKRHVLPPIPVSVSVWSRWNFLTGAQDKYITICTEGDEITEGGFYWQTSMSGPLRNADLVGGLFVDELQKKLHREIGRMAKEGSGDGQELED